MFNIITAVPLAGILGDEVSIPLALLLSLVGFLMVFAVLLLLIGIIKLLTAIVGGKKAEPAPAAAAVTAAPAPAAKLEAAPGSCGDIKLHNVPDATAAMVMAIVADELDTPINELKFKSIKEVE